MYKRLVSLFVVLVLLLSCFPVSVLATDTLESQDENIMATYYVSPNGSDSASGKTADQAFATLQQAQEAVREENAMV